MFNLLENSLESAHLLIIKLWTHLTTCKWIMKAWWFILRFRYALKQLFYGCSRHLITNWDVINHLDGWFFFFNFFRCSFWNLFLDFTEVFVAVTDAVVFKSDVDVFDQKLQVFLTCWFLLSIFKHRWWNIMSVLKKSWTNWHYTGFNNVIFGIM